MAEVTAGTTRRRITRPPPPTPPPSGPIPIARPVSRPPDATPATSTRKSRVGSGLTQLVERGQARQAEEERQDRDRLANVTPARRRAADRSLRTFTDPGGQINAVEAIRSGRGDNTLRDAGLTARQVRSARRIADTVDELAQIPGAVTSEGVDLQVALDSGITPSRLRGAGFDRQGVTEAQQAIQLQEEGRKFKGRARSLGGFLGR